MSKIHLDQNIWLLVCNAKKALLLQNAGDNAYPKLETRHVMEHTLHRSREVGSDAPGRVFSSTTSRRAAMDEGDPHLEEERSFLRGVADDLKQRIEDGEVKCLIVVAPPRALGILREMECRQIKRATIAELPRDYVMLPLYEIEGRLKAENR
ncbi:MAG: host attachment protein [Proteobacteria bacterium]|nr:host attachment protein [Pseudomonadota bacterium]